MVGDIGERMAQPCLAVDAIDIGCSDQRVGRAIALAAPYGTSANYQHLGEYLQLNYGNEAAACQVSEV